MYFIKKKFVILFFMILFITGPGYAADQHASEYPLKIKYGQLFTITYKNDQLKKIIKPAIVKDVNLLLYENKIDNPRRVAMIYNKDEWAASISIKDTSVQLIMWAFEIITNTGDVRKTYYDYSFLKYGDAVLCDITGRPVRNAFMKRALSFASSEGERKENIREAMLNIKKEIGFYPDNTEARILYYALLLKSGKNKEQVAEIINRDVDRLREVLTNRRFLKFSLKAYRMAGLNKKIESIEKELIKSEPKGEIAAEKAFKEIMRLRDSVKRMSELESFIVDFPDSPIRTTALTAIASAAIENDDTVKMTEAGDKLLKEKPNYLVARSLAGLAGSLAEKRVNFSKALTYINKAVEILSKAKKEMPPGIDKEEWQERINVTEGRYKDILGWIFYLKGDNDSALNNLSEAVKLTRQPGVYFHYGEVLLNTGKKEDAVKWLAKASVFGGEVSDSAYTELVRLWTFLGRSEEDLKLYVRKEADNLKTSYTKKVLSRRKNITAPDFKLITVDGEWEIALSDQKGSVVFLCFWAAWSRSSAIMLDELDKLSKKWGDSVLFLTITTDNDIEKAISFIRRKKMSLPVLINNETDKAYNVKGVPTLFVIDKKGVIRFVHRGFRPDLKDVLAIEVNDLIKHKQ